MSFDPKNMYEVDRRVRARLAKIAKDQDEGIYAKHYKEDAEALLGIIEGFVTYRDEGSVFYAKFGE